MSYQIKPEELIYQSKYSWNVEPGDNPQVIGKPDRERFDRSEGYETINMINHICELTSIDNLFQAVGVEKGIWEYLPPKMVMRDEVIEYLEDYVRVSVLK